MQAAGACGAPLHLWDAHRHPLEALVPSPNPSLPLPGEQAMHVTALHFSQVR